MDGFGHNHLTMATLSPPRKSPASTSCWRNGPLTQIGASGLDVGLPEGQMGNSEVGHTNIGAGRLSRADAHHQIHR